MVSTDSGVNLLKTTNGCWLGLYGRSEILSRYNLGKYEDPVIVYSWTSKLSQAKYILTSSLLGFPLGLYVIVISVANYVKTHAMYSDLD